VHNYFLIEHNCSHFIIYNFKPELKIWKNYRAIKIIILLFLMSQIIIDIVNNYQEKKIT